MDMSCDTFRGVRRRVDDLVEVTVRSRFGHPVALWEARVIEVAESGDGSLNVGALVSARWEQGIRWYSGVVAAVNGDGSLAIQYDDGDYEAKVLPRHAKRRLAISHGRPPPLDPRYPNRHCCVCVRFRGFSSEFDEWIPADSKRIRPPMPPGSRLCAAFSCTRAH